MQLFSEVPISPPNFDITYQDGIFCLGSCFVAEMGKKLLDAKFKTLVNPFGTQFHPLAMQHVFSRIYSRIPYNEKEIFNYKDLFFSWDHSHYFSCAQRNKTLDLVNETVETGNEFLHNSSVFIFTLGTAWAYYLREGEFYVSNCHKVPQRLFDKHLLSKNVVLEAIRNLVLMVLDVKPKAKIIFTVSPVRHTKDGFRENHISKGVLHQGLHELLQEFPQINYFPSYELVMDEMRDYRFFAEDLVHLNELGVNYIWEKFKSHYFADTTLDLMQQVQKLKMSLAHKPLNPEGIEHRKFLYDAIKNAEKLQIQLPKDCLKEEIKELKNRIHVD